MKIAICGSLTFHREMRAIQRELETLGHTTLVPRSLALIEQAGFQKPVTVKDRLIAEEKYHFLREHFQKIEASDAILIVNPEKNGIAGYIGGNTFLEMGVAYYLKKPIYVFTILPTMDYTHELAAMVPIVLHGDLSKI